MIQAMHRCPIRLLAYCLTPNHWHMVLWPRSDGDLTSFLSWLTMTHAQRWHTYHGTVGSGHLYQGRFKSFPVQSDEYFYQVVRYVERNALRAQLVETAEAWRWSSLWRQVHGTPEQKAMLSRWPLPRPRDWVKLVNEVQTEAEVEAIQRAVRRGQPYGSPDWVEETARRLGLESTLRAPHRPRKRSSA